MIVELRDIKNESVTWTGNQNLKISVTSDNQVWEDELTFFDEVNVDVKSLKMKLIKNNRQGESY